ncbi:MAG: hypothetical protein RMJ56_18015 [Gemmataceae bacterium]|nr:hypothetical protein [Gemmata sp.]MDW8199492.1 hypothetical protein [Gemmataceae bacterium]
MTTVEHGELHVVVPVGFLLAEAQEVTVSVNRPGGEPLPVRLKLVPARPIEEPASMTPGCIATACSSTSASSAATRTAAWSRSNRRSLDELYGEPEYGGGD